jgi:hypothetical protein
MNKLLILSGLPVFILETWLSAHAAATPHAAGVTVERSAAHSQDADRYSDASCTVRIFTMTKSDGTQALRKSVDCEE